MSSKPEPVDVFVGANIRFFRLSKNMSQADLARAIGVTFQQVQKYEKGANRVGASRLSRIANVLEVPVSSFFGKADDKDKQRLEANSPLKLLGNAYSLRMVRALAEISDTSLRRQLVQFIETVAHLERASRRCRQH